MNDLKNISRREILEESLTNNLLNRALQLWKNGDYTFEECLKIYTIKSSERIKTLEAKLLHIEIHNSHPNPIDLEAFK